MPNQTLHLTAAASRLSKVHGSPAAAAGELGRSAAEGFRVSVSIDPALLVALAGGQPDPLPSCVSRVEVQTLGDLWLPTGRPSKPASIRGFPDEAPINWNYSALGKTSIKLMQPRRSTSKSMTSPKTSAKLAKFKNLPVALLAAWALLPLLTTFISTRPLCPR